MKLARLVVLLALPLLSGSITASAQKWTDPTPEELSMTSQPEVPGAGAVYLFREEMTDDQLHVFSIYVRLKVLTEKGKDYANVEINYANRSDGSGTSITDVAGRTIHPDGKVIPYTGKPYDKLIEQTQDEKHKAKVFTLPDVDVGSIIEYRYSIRYDDMYFIAPQWYIQSELFTRKAHYRWKPTDKQLISSDERGQLTNTISWTPILPKDAEIKSSRLAGDGQATIEVNVKNIMPTPDEVYMPPIGSFSYRVLFYYTPYRSEEEYWKNEGKHWAKVSDKFIGPESGVKAAVQQLVSPSDTADQKLHKIYGAVMEMENTDFTHEHSAAEEKSQGLKEARNTDDILARKRGDSDQLTELFVAMARAAGMKAYLMMVTNRDRHIFLKAYFSLRQLDDAIALVDVDGKQLTFDPGSRYCQYGQLAWKHTLAGGLRQNDSGAEIAYTPEQESVSSSQILRVANLTMNDQGEVTGKVDLTYMGSPALRWRQVALRQDRAGLEDQMQRAVESMMPAGMEVKVASVDNLTAYDKPLVASFTVKGPIGSATGKRLLIPGDIFESRAKPTFSHDKREQAVYFDYPYVTRDAVRVNFPANAFTVESLPASETEMYQTAMRYELKTEQAPASVTFRRSFQMAGILYKAEEYKDIREFYNKFESKDQENVVLKVGSDASGNMKGSGN
jgi:Domain of Unknown Function with PDB structure (DUF3857)/Transglutaminase-like superfamily